MAKVFLSYDRDDTERARPIALALEKAGNMVWWDPHIRGGEQFSKAIEEALQAADAIVVLWSRHSIESPWVRDEAAMGRDSGRLVPVSLDDTQPPLGFRQFQTVSLSRWKGRGKPPVTDLLNAIAGIVGDRPEHPTVAIDRPPPLWSRSARLMLLALLLVALATTAFLLIGRRGEFGIHTIGVTAADEGAQPLARDLLVNLGRLQSAKSGSVRLVGTLPKDIKSADLIFEAASDHDPSRLGLSLVLMDGRDHSILWTKDFIQESGSLPELRLQVGYTAVLVLDCALEGLLSKNPSLPQQTLKLYLNACADASDLAGSDPRPVRPALLEVVRHSPKFRPAWQLLLLVEGDVVGSLIAEGQANSPERREFEDHIAQAKKLHPGLPEADLADLVLIPRREIQRRQELIAHAIANHPRSVAVLDARAQELRSVGRLYESIQSAKLAMDLDPLSPIQRNSYIFALAYAGRIEDAEQELREAERLWPGTGTLRDIQFRFHLRYGDPQLALKLTPRQIGGLSDGNRLFLQARAEPTPDNIQRFLDYALDGEYPAGAMGYLSQALGEFHREAELYDIVIRHMPGSDIANLGDIWFRPTLRTFRKDPRFMQVMKRGGLVDYWRRSGKWPDFCFDEKLPYDCKAEAAKLAA